MEIKGPFSYSGNKYKIYNKHLRNTIDEFDYVVEMFSGSAAILYNSTKGGCAFDVEPAVVFLHNSLSDKNLYIRAQEVYNEFFPNGRDKEGYLRLRNHFNRIYAQKSFSKIIAPHFYVLVQLSFNSLIRFGPNGYNVPFGKKNFDSERIKIHSEIYNKKSLKFYNKSYTNIDLTQYSKENTLIYFDPPYSASKYKYGGWSHRDEVSLLNFIDVLNQHDWKFIMSNTFLHREIENQTLIEWSQKYFVKYIDQKYHSWASSVKDVEKVNDTVEVIISNFQI